MVTPKKVTAAKNADAVEKVVLVAVEPIKHDGQEAKPGDQFLALPDDVPGLIEAGLAAAVDVPEVQQA